jgi:hypothetical protein
MSAEHLKNVSFSTREELISYIKSYYLEKNVVTVLHKHSCSKKVTFKCYHGGKYERKDDLTETSRQRKTGTHLLGCPFRIKGSLSLKSKLWSVRIIEDIHNHECDPNGLAGISVARRLKEPEKDIVRNMSAAGCNAAEIVSFIKSNSSNQYVTRQEIYNQQSLNRRAFLAGRSPIQALVDQVQALNYVYEIKCGINGEVTGFFFCHRESVALARRYRTTFLMDCTYKTNRFGMPLLNIVGVTATNGTFNAGLAFLSNETQEMYTWAMQSFKRYASPDVVVTDKEAALISTLESEFPSAHNLLCVWHVQKNVLAHASKRLKNDDVEEFMKGWTDIIHSETQKAYEIKWSIFHDHWAPNQEVLVKYVHDTWLLYKTKLVRCWTDCYAHFGSTSTSRCEGFHAVVKKILRIVHNDLLTAFQKINEIGQKTQKPKLSPKVYFLGS